MLMLIAHLLLLTAHRSLLIAHKIASLVSFPTTSPISSIPLEGSASSLYSNSSDPYALDICFSRP